MRCNADTNSFLDARHARRSALGDRGFILLPVLFTVSLLAIIAILVSKSTILDLKVTNYLARRQQAELIADGVTRLAIARIMLNRPGGTAQGKLRADGTPLLCTWNGARSAISVADVAGQVDLNGAPMELLRELLKGVGVKADEADSLAQAILDFRSSGSSPEESSGRAAAYRAAGLPFGPKNDRFESVGELAQVLGVTPELFDRLHDLVTVHSGLATVDPDVASQVLRNMSLARRHIAKSISRTFLIRTEVDLQNGANFRRQAVIDLTPRSATGFGIREWGSLERPLLPVEGVDQDADCADVLKP